VTDASVAADPDVLVWHRRDLRTADSAALAAAADAGRPCPAFVLDPAFYDDRGLACDARVAFLFECLADLRRQYRDLGSDLALLAGETVPRLRAALREADALSLNRAVTTGRGREWAREVRSWPETRAFGDDGVVREGPSREGWADQCEAYFEADPPARPDSLPPNPLDSDLTLDDARDRWDVTPEKAGVPRGGTAAGEARLDRFVDTLDRYPRSVSRPAAAERDCSRLSPYLKFGALSSRQVYRAVADAPACRGREMFVSRLFWNRHYTQKLADWPDARFRSVNPVFRNLRRDDHDPELVAAWKEGRTGFPMVDASMRCLVETGWLNFRMRAMCATVFAHLLGEWWRRGADFFYYHLVDADPAINYEQWQAQAGLVGAHPVRVYDPEKQAREYDPDGTFVREYVPELAALPDEHLPRPEKAPLPVQEEAGVSVGEDYPYPVVDYEARAAAARERMASLHDRAREALYSDPELLRRASLSRRDRDGDESPTAEDGRRGQARLDEF
jgi:deoxyribodipyrimidine photo-lyase